MSRISEEEENREGITRHVSIATEPDISAFAPGEGSRVIDGWVEIAGKRVTEVPVGAEFDILCSYEAYNAAGGLISSWSACVTVIDTITKTVKNYNWDSSAFTTAAKISNNSLKLNKLGKNIMPNSDVSLRFKLWGSDVFSPSTPPAQASW